MKMIMGRSYPGSKVTVEVAPGSKGDYGVSIEEELIQWGPCYVLMRTYNAIWKQVGWSYPVRREATETLWRLDAQLRHEFWPDMYPEPAALAREGKPPPKHCAKHPGAVWYDEPLCPACKAEAEFISLTDDLTST